jgi:EAL domain-containing protein (putative c-di-GMP-specific phosphodiesterase class I)
MADIALYQAKASGRNCHCFFDPSMGVAASERLELEGELRHAVQSGQFVLRYQPIVGATSHRVCAAEALVRWQHPIRGLVSPDQFIPLAEEAGLIHALGEWVLREACREAASWPAAIKIAVNLSPVQLKAGFVEVVRGILIETGLEAGRLELEITETALISPEGNSIDILHELKRLGVAIALDDFGTGYSSLSLLTMFPFDRIKIDRSFTRDVARRNECSIIISAIVMLARNLAAVTTAEGVEDHEQCRLLQVAGVDSLQGYLFARPMLSRDIDFGRVYSEAVRAA